MEPEIDSRGAAWRARLREAALAELDRSGLSLEFEEPLRGMYAARENQIRPGELAWVARLGSLGFVAIVLLLNLFVLATPNWRMVLIETTAVPAMALVFAQVFFRPGVHPALRDAAGIACGSMLSLITVLGVAPATGDEVLPGYYLATLPVIFVLIFARPRFPLALIFTAFSAGCLAAALFYRTDLPPQLRFYPLAFELAAAIPALAGVHGLERAARKVYLHGILQGLQIEELALQNERLEQLSNTDPLTGIANRRRLDMVLNERLAGAVTEDFLLLVDVDHFKRFNDMHGHLAGNACLKELAARMALEVRSTDLLARFGDEEFAIFAPRTSLPAVLDLCERLRAAVASYRTGGAAAEPMTVSIGIADRTRDCDAALLIARADAALYAAKRAGRNCIRRADQVWGQGSDTRWAEPHPGAQDILGVAPRQSYPR